MTAPRLTPAPSRTPRSRTRRRRGAAIALVVAVVGAGCGDGSSAAVDELVACGETTTQQYATHDGFDPGFNSLDVYRPAATDGDCSERPLVVWIHGGGWTEGDKTENVEDKIRLFNDAGFVFASINYRLTDPDLVPPAPQYPVHNQDGADAIAWLVEHAAEIGADGKRIAILGHSAGGGIVAAVSTDPTYLRAHGLELESLTCAASIDGEGYDVAAGATHEDPMVHSAYLTAFGDDPAVWADASPVNHVAAGTGIPDFFVAARGVAFRLAFHAEFVIALSEADVPTTVIDARALDHNEVSVEIGADGDTVVTPELMEFLTGCFSERS